MDQRRIEKERKDEATAAKEGSRAGRFKDVDAYRASDRVKVETSRGWRSDGRGRQDEPRVAWREKRREKEKRE